ncbi:MAG: 4Fe-4S dicluster domain-containing protein, partial [Hyphomicrobiales bacterium]|nr:4Fe-4S dicluster domain-containing protein [Hyphomicrobiales bacterium]
EYRALPLRPVLDWSEFPGGAGGFQGAVEMCNNNGACRKLEGGAMCPSYRVTRDEEHVTRGRANTLRLALSGALGKEALASDGVAEALELCVSCKACKRECPTGVDMARMKIEVDAARAQRNGITLFDRLVGNLPRYAPLAARFAWLLNLRDRVPGAALLSEWVTGFAARRPLPVWRSDFFRAPADAIGPSAGREVVLFADSFNRYFEPETVSAALAVLLAGGYRVHLPRAADGSARPLCCGRTYLSTGAIDAARREAKRSLAALAPFAERGVPIIGLEPSCLFSFRDEFLALGMGDAAQRLANRAVMLEEFLAREAQDGTLNLTFVPTRRKALLHTHCHQKAFGIESSVIAALKLVPGLEVDTLASSCCGMAGSFGYRAKTASVSKAMGELTLLPAVRAAASDAIIVADGTSCRHQIADGSGRKAVHVARVLAASLEGTKT